MTDPAHIAEQRRIQSTAGEHFRRLDEVRDAKREDNRAWQMRAAAGDAASSEPAPLIVGRDLIQHLPAASVKTVEDVMRETAQVDFRPQQASDTPPQAPAARTANNAAVLLSPDTFM